MDKEDIKFIKFRTELIELLNKYNYELSGSGYDDGSIEITSKKQIYILQNNTSMYETKKEINGKLVDIPFDYILNMFDEEERNIKFNNIGIFTNDFWKATKFFNELFENNKENIDKYINRKDYKEIILKDDIKYIWIKPIDSSRGHRCSKAYIDKNLTLTQLHLIVLPICVYCERKNVEII